MISIFLGLLSPTLPRVLSYGEWRDTESPILLSVEFENLLVVICYSLS